MRNIFIKSVVMVLASAVTVCASARATGHSERSEESAMTLKECMESIRSTADEMITGINRSLDRQKKRDMKNYEMER